MRDPATVGLILRGVALCWAVVVDERIEAVPLVHYRMSRRKNAIDARPRTSQRSRVAWKKHDADAVPRRRSHDAS